MTKEREFEEKTGKKFEVFYKEYRIKLIYHLFKYCKDKSTAQEVCDDAFIKSLEEIEKYNPEKAQYSTWLFTIAANKMKQYLKDQAKLESLEEDHDGATIADFLISEDNTNSKQKELVLAKKMDIIKLEIKKLGEEKGGKKYSDILQMRLIDHLKYDEILEACSDITTINTVKSRIKMGKARLVKKIKNKFKELDEMGV